MSFLLSEINSTYYYIVIPVASKHVRAALVHAAPAPHRKTLIIPVLAPYLVLLLSQRPEGTLLRIRGRKHDAILYCGRF